MMLSGPDVRYEELKAQKGNVQAVHDEFRRITGRTDLTISEVTNWQGEWRYGIHGPDFTLSSTEHYQGQIFA